MSEPSAEAAIDALAADFSFLSDWEERYGHVIDLGRQLAPLAPEELTEANKVRGCASQVWLVTERDGDRLRFRGASDAHIVAGLVAVLVRIFSGRTAAEILAVDPKAAFQRLGLEDALTPQRSNGVFSMIARIRHDAVTAADNDRPGATARA